MLPSRIPGIQYPSVRIIEALHQLSDQSWRPCYLLGQFLFMLNSHNELIFSPCSLGSFVAIVKFILAGAFLWFTYTDEMKEMFQLLSGKVTRLAYLCHGCQMLNSTFADLTCLLVLFLRRKEVTLFQREVTEFLVKLTEGNTEMENITVESLHHTRKLIRRHQIILFGTFGVQLLSMIVIIFIVSLYPPAHVNINLWMSLWKVMPLVIIWTSAVVLRLIGRLSLVGVFRILEITSQVIESRLAHELETPDANDLVAPLNYCLERYRKFEKLVSELNDTFGVYLAIDFLYLIVANAILLFHLGVHLHSGKWSSVLNSGIFVIPNLVIAWVICSAAYRLEERAKNVIHLVKKLVVLGKVLAHCIKVK